MKNLEKFAAMVEAELKTHGVELEKEAFIGAIMGGLGRVVGGVARAGAAVGRGVGAATSGTGNFMRGLGQRFSAGRSAARYGDVAGKAVRGEMGVMAKQRAAGFQPTPGGGVLGPRGFAGRGGPAKVAPSMTPQLDKLRAMRGGAAPAAPVPAAVKAAPAPAAAKAAPTPMASAPESKPKGKGKNWGGGAAMVGASMLMSPGGGQQQAAQPAYAGWGSYRGASFDALFEKVSAAIPDATPEEMMAATLSLAIEEGFRGGILESAVERGFKVAATEKVASDSSEKKGEKKAAIRYTNKSVQDIIGHLSEQWGRPEPIEKDAAAHPAMSKFAKLMEVELARPS